MAAKTSKQSLRVSVLVHMFANCYALKAITIPANVSIIEPSTFSYCYALKAITIPANVSIIKALCRSCFSLTSVTIADVFTIAGYTSPTATVIHTVLSDRRRPCVLWLYTRERVQVFVHHQRLVERSVFSSIPSDCIIYVPLASLSAYQNATNWSTHAAKMVGE